MQKVKVNNKGSPLVSTDHNWCIIVILEAMGLPNYDLHTICLGRVLNSKKYCNMIRSRNNWLYSFTIIKNEITKKIKNR